jgi:transcriptional regulator with XRE-family HTH domain
MARPSDSLLAFLRETITRRGMNTAALAEKAKIDRMGLKRRLSGQEDLTVDELIRIAGVLEIDPQATAVPDPDALPAAGPPPEWVPDPYGNLAKQALRMGFALGVDLFVTFDAKLLADSGVPSAVLARFKDALPIKLEARWHPQNKPIFQEDAFVCVLSFDRLRTCTFPWRSVRQVHFLLPEAAEEPVPPPAPKAGGAPFLRVVK